MTHKRTKTCVVCGNRYIYLWEDDEVWVEYVTCLNCRYEEKRVVEDEKKVAESEPT